MNPRIIIIVGILLVLGAGFAFWRFMADVETPGFNPGDSRTIANESALEPKVMPRREAGAQTEGTKRETEGKSKEIPRDCARVRGRVIAGDPARPFPQARVALLLLGGQILAEGLTDAEGRFALDGPAQESELIFQAAAEGLASQPRVDLELAVGEERDLGDILLQGAQEIRGRVRAVEGNILADATVLLLPNIPLTEGAQLDILRLFRSLIEDDEPLARLQTDENGAFAFKGVAPGEYGLVVESPGRQVKFSERIILQEGQAAAEVELLLEAGQQLEGRVTDPKGEPVADALIAIMPQSRGMPGLIRTLKARTDGDGHYELDILGVGRHQMLVRAEGFCPFGDSIKIADDEKLVKDIRLEPGVTLKGRFVNRVTAAGVPDVVVFALHKRAPIMIEGKSDAEGYFKIEHAPDIEQAALVIRKEGMKYSDSPGLKTEKGPFEMVRFVETEGELPPYERTIFLSGGATISGRVIDQATGRGIAGARVIALGGAGIEAALLGSGSSTTSDADGRFELADVAAGPFMLVASARGYQMQEELNSRELGRRSTRESWPHVELGQALVDQNINLVLGARQAGIVRDPDGRPLAGAIAHWGPRDSNDESAFGLMMLDSTNIKGVVTDEDGRFVIEGLRAGMDCQFQFRHSDYPGGARLVIEAAMIGRKEIDVRMSLGAVIAGRLLGPEGAPVAGMVVQLSYADRIESFWARTSNNQQIQSDSEGRFAFESLPGGSFEIRVEDSADYRMPRNYEREIVVAGGDTKEVEYRLLRNNRIGGILLDSKGQPVADRYLKVDAEDPGGILAAERTAQIDGESQRDDKDRGSDISRTDSNGRFSSEGLDGRFSYRVTVMVEGWSPWSNRVTRRNSDGSISSSAETSDDIKGEAMTVEHVAINEKNLRISLPAQ